MGLSFVWEGIHHSEQTFSTNASRSNGSLLLLSMLVLIVPSVYSYSVEGERGALMDYPILVILLL